MTRCPVCDAPAPSRRIAVLYGIMAGLFLAAVIYTLFPPLIRYALHLPEPVPQSALTSCEEKLRDFAAAGAVAEAIEEGRARR